MDGDYEAADRARDGADGTGAQYHSFTREIALELRGIAALLRGDDYSATDYLRQAVDSMCTTGHRLELPAAAAYLSAALWRVGDEEGSDRAAALALSTAEEIDALQLPLVDRKSVG